LKIAAIDIGSNAARLLICEVIERKKLPPQFIKLNLVRVPLRLGFDVFEYGFITAKKEADIIHTLKSYQLLMQVHEVDHYVACATSAMRDARNAEEIIGRVIQQTGIVIKVISGKEEAATIFENHIENYLDKEHSYLYIDVGGGSTELTLFDNNIPVFEESFNIGTIRMLKNKVDDKEWQRFKEFVKSEVKPFKNLMGIGSGGNINKIFSMSKRKEGRPLNALILKEYFDELGKMTVEDRMIKFNLREDRADVIMPALQIYNSVMRWAAIDEIYVPKFGLADGLVRSLYNSLQKAVLV
jgi:exopolyphosphatase/guanosine-5'-triphosphate,3'-diphosphate pyrophosphatase